MFEYSICQEQPWVCTSLLRIILQEHLLLVSIFTILCILTAFLIVIAIPFIKQKKHAYHPLVTFFAAFLFLFFSPVAMLQLVLAQQGTLLTSATVKCMLLKAPNKCYEFAAVTLIQRDTTEAILEKSFAICDLGSDSAKCKVAVCDYSALNPEDVTSFEKQQCWQKIAPTCQDGVILPNVPCGCYSAELGRYAAYTEEWYRTYWEVYRKMDPPPYCCNGSVSSRACAP